jgi:hypothetical protein
VLRMVPFCLHAVANTPAGRMEFVRSYDSTNFGPPDCCLAEHPCFGHTVDSKFGRVQSLVERTIPTLPRR